MIDRPLRGEAGARAGRSRSTRPLRPWRRHDFSSWRPPEDIGSSSRGWPRPSRASTRSTSRRW